MSASTKDIPYSATGSLEVEATGSELVQAGLCGTDSAGNQLAPLNQTLFLRQFNDGAVGAVAPVVAILPPPSPSIAESAPALPAGELLATLLELSQALRLSPEQIRDIRMLQETDGHLLKNAATPSLRKGHESGVAGLLKSLKPWQRKRLQEALAQKSRFGKRRSTKPGMSRGKTYGQLAPSPVASMQLPMGHRADQVLLSEIQGDAPEPVRQESKVKRLTGTKMLGRPEDDD